MTLLALGLRRPRLAAPRVVAMAARGRRVRGARSAPCGARCCRRRPLLDALADGIASLTTPITASASPRRTSRACGGWSRPTTAWAARLRAQRQDLYQRELLLDTVIQASPLALVLTNATGTLLYANLAARQLLGGGRKLEGLALSPLLESMPASLREAFAGQPRPAVHRRAGRRSRRCSTSRTASSC